MSPWSRSASETFSGPGPSTTRGLGGRSSRRTSTGSASPSVTEARPSLCTRGTSSPPTPRCLPRAAASAASRSRTSCGQRNESTRFWPRRNVRAEASPSIPLAPRGEATAATSAIRRATCGRWRPAPPSFRSPSRQVTEERDVDPWARDALDTFGVRPRTGPVAWHRDRSEPGTRPDVALGCRSDEWSGQKAMRSQEELRRHKQSARLDPTVDRRQGHEVVDVDESEDPSDGRRYKPPAGIFEPLWIAELDRPPARPDLAAPCCQHVENPVALGAVGQRK